MLNSQIIKTTSFQIREIISYKVLPKMKTFSPIHGRTQSGFMFLLIGECTYKTQSSSFIMSPNSIAYLPKGSHYTFSCQSLEISYYLLNFESFDVKGEPLVFADSPTLLDNKLSKIIIEEIKEIIHLTDSSSINTNLNKTALFYSILTKIFSAPNDLINLGKLAPAIHYLHENFNLKIKTAQLAKLCYLSESHFRKLFIEKFETTPVNYRQRIQLEKAKELLGHTKLTINEIAINCGFKNQQYFTKLFKEQTGQTPKSYQKSTQNSWI